MWIDAVDPVAIDWWSSRVSFGNDITIIAIVAIVAVVAIVAIVAIDWFTTIATGSTGSIHGKPFVMMMTWMVLLTSIDWWSYRLNTVDLSSNSCACMGHVTSQCQCLDSQLQQTARVQDAEQIQFHDANCGVRGKRLKAVRHRSMKNMRWSEACHLSTWSNRAWCNST